MTRVSGPARSTTGISSIWVRYCLGGLAAALTLLAWLLLGTYLQPSPFPLFLVAVMVVTLLLGVGPSLAVLILGLIATSVTYRPSPHVLPDLPLQLGVFAVLSLGIMWLNSRHRRMGRALRQSQEQLSQIVDSSLIGVHIADLDGGIFDANDAFLRIVGYTRHDLVGGLVRWDHLTPPEYDALDRKVREYARAHGAHPPFEKEYIRKDGRRVPVLVGVTMLAGSDDEAVTFVLDLTERRQIDEERERFNEQKDTFLLAVAHDLKTPLTTIKGSAQLMKHRLAHPDSIDVAPLRSGTLTIERMANRMVREIEDLLDVVRDEIGRPFDLSYEPVDLVRILHEIAGDAEAWGTKHRVVVDTEASELVGEFDRGRLMRALCNLIDNALKYSPGGGELAITLRPYADREAIITIVDHGMGIPEADIPNLFTPFYRGSNVGPIGGSGVGLAGVKQVIDLHGGTIDVRSREGQGTEVTICLPIHPRNPQVARVHR